ncbi:hypothetical protein Y88_0541 [Novosphingobium nitrogenifigens DSM 19370]|uniref:Uncharacterized protein n=1 Tax=Novosphingobium nitrogenifigens DSM 19370 TaxID=983920 RepID=F1ZAA7_9SPHN|nr:hypothetical protein [Novosphingobium nitrogenifigens]EGD58485.1 hypothetical protein Y88_0541 [Novosphingobium nitrogenifigens DSM 19370]
MTAQDIATKPLDDLNIKRDRLAPILDAALADPYGLRNSPTCASLALEIAALDSALGPDIDSAPTLTTGEKRTRAVGTAAREVVSSFIPFDGVVRVVSGANASDRKRQLYLYAGSLRRSFLKGYGVSQHCTFPPLPAQAPKETAKRK